MAGAIDKKIAEVKKELEDLDNQEVFYQLVSVVKLNMQKTLFILKIWILLIKKQKYQSEYLVELVTD